MDTTYSASHRKYYEANKEKINERRREYNRQYASTYYEQNKDAINERRRKHTKPGRPKKSSPTPQNENSAV